MQCNHCGKVVPEGVKFCGHCGTSIAVVQDAVGQSAFDEAPTRLAPSAQPELAKATGSIPEKRRRDRKEIKIPLWGWVTIAACVLGIGLFLIFRLFTPTTIIHFGGRCQDTFYAQANERLELHYGHWGVLGEELIADNDEAISNILYLNGVEYHGQRARPASTGELPCQTQSSYSAEFWEEGQWLHDKVTVSLSPGTYRVEFVTMLSRPVSDGLDGDNNGELDMYGPGVIQRWEFTLVVRE